RCSPAPSQPGRCRCGEGHPPCAYPSCRFRPSCLLRLARCNEPGCRIGRRRFAAHDTAPAYNRAMQYGLGIFPTDYTIAPDDLARQAEDRGFDSLWVTEHTRIPVSRKSPWPGGPELPKEYLHTYDPFIALSVAAAVTKTLKLATGVCLVVEHDPI